MGNSLLLTLEQARSFSLDLIKTTFALFSALESC